MRSARARPVGVVHRVDRVVFLALSAAYVAGKLDVVDAPLVVGGAGPPACVADLERLGVAPHGGVRARGLGPPAK